MRKLTTSQVIDLLKQIGVQDVDIVADDAATDNPFEMTDFLTAIDSSRKPIIEQSVLSEHNKKIYDTVTLKVNTAMRDKVARITGTPAAELKDKTADELTEVLSTHYAKTSTASPDAINAKMQEMMQAWAAEKETLIKTGDDKYNQLLNQYQTKEKMDLLVDIYKTSKGIDPKANHRLLAEDFLEKLEREAIVKIGEDKKIALYDKNNPEIRLTNTSNTGFETIESRMKSFHAPRMQWNEDTRRDSAKAEMEQRAAPPLPRTDSEGISLTERESAMAAINAM